MTHRRVPGEGDFDLVGFVRTLDGMGVDAAYAIEVISVELDELPVDQVVRSVADATRDVLARARGRPRDADAVRRVSGAAPWPRPARRPARVPRPASVDDLVRADRRRRRPRR